eukprot:scaffold2473_cov247-Pinguiococcus_pyrenoidosus.AAC.17
MGSLVLVAIVLLVEAQCGHVLQLASLADVLQVVLQVLALASDDVLAHVLDLPPHFLLAHPALPVGLRPRFGPGNLHPVQQLHFSVAPSKGVAAVELEVFQLHGEQIDGLRLPPHLHLAEPELFGAEADLGVERMPLARPRVGPALLDLVGAQVLKVLLQLRKAAERLRLEVADIADAPFVPSDSSFGVVHVLSGVAHVALDVLNLLVQAGDDARALLNFPCALEPLEALAEDVALPGAHDNPRCVVPATDGGAPARLILPAGLESANAALDRQRRRLLVASLELLPDLPSFPGGKDGAVELLYPCGARPLPPPQVEALLVPVPPKLSLDAHDGGKVDFEQELPPPQQRRDLPRHHGPREALESGRHPLLQRRSEPPPPQLAVLGGGAEAPTDAERRDLPPAASKALPFCLSFAAEESRATKCLDLRGGRPLPLSFAEVPLISASAEVTLDADHGSYAAFGGRELVMQLRRHQLLCHGCAGAAQKQRSERKKPLQWRRLELDRRSRTQRVRELFLREIRER